MTSYNYPWEKTYDPHLLKEFNWFLKKVNERALIESGILQTNYDAVRRCGTPCSGLGFDVEYFHPTISLDDRMRFIAEEIAGSSLSENDKIGNTLISHFYGARGIHWTASGVEGELIDFQAAADDPKYLAQIRSNLDAAKTKKIPIWGTTELHTSIQTAARNYARAKEGNPSRLFHPVDVIEWVASFRDSGVFQALKKAEHIKDAYDVLVSQKGIGDYYGFHGAASTSVLPFLRYHHDQRFVAPGPGAVYTISKLWPQAPKKLYDEAVYFLRERAEEIGLVDGVHFHPECYNINEVFFHPQDSLKYYGTEVACCQYGIYLQIRDDPKACARRKVARVSSSKTLGNIL